ncbi:MAG: HYR domain-containing protein [Saprospiraceae bacterium]|nr:HYR domain-containing protein [Saprospiraceae bacterium]
MISRISLILYCVSISGLLTAQQPSAALQSTESTFFMQTNAERGYAICPSGDGNFYIAGRKDNQVLLQKMTPDGAFLFSRKINVSDGLPDVVADLIVDSEGMVLLAVNSFEDQPLEPFVLRYDPANNEVMWTRSFKGQLHALFGLMENGPGGNIVVYHTVRTGGGDDAQISQLDRNTGDWIPNKSYRYNLGSSDEINAMVLDKDGAYAVGRFTDGSGNVDMRQMLMKVDLETGQPQWTRLGHVAADTSARLYGRDLVLDQDAIVSTYSGNESSDALSSTQIFLQKTTKSGDLLWLNRYDLPEWNTEFAEELVSVSDGYVLLGRSLVEDQGWVFMLKTDKDGNALWARKFEHEYNNDLIGYAQGQLVAMGDYLYATGYTEHVSANSRMFVLKTAADGSVSNTCTALEPTPVQWTEIMNPAFYPVTLERPSPDLTFQTVTVTKPAESLATQLFVCQQDGVDACQDLPDATFTMDSIVCAGGKASLYYTQCNLGNVPLGSFLVRFYPGNPTQVPGDEVETLLLLNNTPLAAGECRNGSISIALSNWFPAGTLGAQEVFSLANIDNDATYPVSLDSFPFSSFEECLYTNNLSSLTIVLEDPSLDLGPDVISCTGDPITLNAGPGFFKYAWNNGAQTQSIQVSDPGVYWVEVTDDCGFKHRDSLFYTFSLITDTRFPDTTICPGSAVDFLVPGFTAYTWAPASGLSCTNCAAVTISPANTTTYTLLASDTLGCTLRDTFTVFVIQDSDLSIDCPANLTVAAAAGATAAVVDYPIGVSSDCLCGGPTLLRTQGLASGASFPLGTTQVCYSASDGCGTTSACCFTVNVTPTSVPTDEPCDVKITPCIKYEILGIFQNPAKQKTYRIRLTNTCAQKLVYAAFQLPDGLIADKPATAVFTSPAGRQYEVRNPNYSPFYSIRFKAIGDGIAGGQSDIFEYTLPQQADPQFIHAIVRLEPQTFYETHMNVFACEVQQVANRPEAGDRTQALVSTTEAPVLQVYPNPASDLVQVDLSAWAGQSVRLLLTNAFGQVVLDQGVEASGEPLPIRLPAEWARGLYQLQVRTATRACATTRFVLQR